MKVPRLAAQSLNRWLERTHRPKAVSLVACVAALVAALAGCQSQQTNPGDPFLPFMRTRVPSPGTNVPADSYYQGAPATAAPPASMPPPASAPSAVPPGQPDRYAPPGGYNLPQSSIDRSKVSNPATGEVKAGGTAIARRSLAKPTHGQSTVDTQLTAAKVTGATAAGATAATAGAAATATAQETPPADSLAATEPDNASVETPADASAESPTEMVDTRSSDGAAVAFAETPDATNTEAPADETGSDESDRRTPLASAGKWSSGGGPPEQTLAANKSTLRILGTEENASGDGSADDTDADRADAGSRQPGESDLAIRTGADDSDEAATAQADSDYVVSTAGGELAHSVTWSNPPQASPIGSTEQIDQTATLAMAGPTSTVVQTGWNEPAAATATPVSSAGTARANGPGARASQAYGYDPSYGWLRGRLEYSASQQQWKLRYIPIDGATDQFGGSVVLATGAATQGLRAGDFVTAQGRVVGATQPGRGFSPRYEVASIEPVAGSN